MVSTPIDDGHSFIDMGAGTIIAVLCIKAARAMAVRAAAKPSLPIVATQGRTN